MRACFIDDEVNVMCAIGSTCEPMTGGDCSIAAAGFAVDIVRSIARRLSLTVTEACIQSFDDASECDIVAGSLRQARVYASRGWISSGAYNADSAAIMFEPKSAIAPWSFLLPFAPVLWAVIAIIVFVVTPLVSSVVEYDEGETVAKNFQMYLPDSVHAYTGVDALKRTGSNYSKESAVLSAAVAVVGQILIALYSCNLAAYVITSYLNTSPTAQSVAWVMTHGKVAVSPGFYDTVRATDIVRVDSAQQGLRMYRDHTARAFVAGETYLRNVQTCGDAVRRLDGPHIFKTMALSSNFSRATEFDMELRTRLLEFPPVVIDALRCPKVARSIGLESTFGIFATFGVCIAIVSVASVIAHALRHEECGKKESPEGPDSLPESYHA